MPSITSTLARQTPIYGACCGVTCHGRIHQAIDRGCRATYHVVAGRDSRIQRGAVLWGLFQLRAGVCVTASWLRSPEERYFTWRGCGALVGRQVRSTHRRWPSGKPRLRAFCRSAPAVRFMALTIFLTGDLLRECALSSRTSSFDQGRRLVRRARLVAINPSLDGAPGIVRSLNELDPTPNRWRREIAYRAAWRQVLHLRRGHQPRRHKVAGGATPGS